MTDELVAWLREQVDADERVAQAAADPECYFDMLSSSRAEEAFMFAFDPARVLAEVAAKRRIIDELERLIIVVGWTEEEHGGNDTESLRDLLRLLASVYAGRPGWREEWAADEEVQRG